MIEIREAREEDRKSAVRVMWKAFESTESFDDVIKKDWVKNWHRPEKEDWAFVAVDDDKVVANLCVFATENNIIRSKPVRFGGVWAVATEPSYRRRGLVTKLFDIAFDKMKDVGCVLSILDPFYRPFYEKYGYALAEARARYKFKKEHIRTGQTDQTVFCREATLEDIDKYLDVERSMSRFGSRFFTSQENLLRGFKRGDSLIFERDGSPVGTVWFFYSKARSGHGKNLTVGGTRYVDDSVFPSIIEQVRNYSADVDTINWYTDLSVPVRYYFSSIHNSESFRIGSMMMRVIDFEGYCKSIAVPESASEPVSMTLSDSQCPWNEGTYRVVPEDGRLSVERISDEHAEVTLDSLQLSEVISGLTPPNLLRSLKRIDCKKDTAQKLEAIFPEDNFVSYVRF